MAATAVVQHEGWPMITSLRRHKLRQNGSAGSAEIDSGPASAASASQGRVAGAAWQNPDGSPNSRGGLSPAMQVSVLALNRHFAAVHVVSVQRAFCMLWKGTAEVIDFDGGHYMSYNFERWCENSQLKQALEAADDTEDWIRAVSYDIQVPRIIRLLRYDRTPRNTVKFNRRNIFLRDEHCCQYCQKQFPRQQLSLDHIQPRSRGGENSWENIVCACRKCNVRKGGRTPQEAGMALMRPPVQPTRSPLISRQLSNKKYAVWHMFLRSD
jgi:5-methylcytosine-specific restriction endonuclease McrA